MADSKKSKLFSKYLSRMNTIKKEPYAAELFAGLEAGKNSYMRIDRLESSNFDMTWINQIEDCIYELGDIVSNPKQVTKTVTGIVPVELARKTGAESVQHLASHTQYIKEITEQGDVVPNKILNIGSEDDIHTYENRFIATLIRRLVLFIEKRYEFVKKFSILHDEEILYYKTKAIVDGSEVEIETKIKVKSESDSEMAITSNNYVNRIAKLREYILYYYGSRFMKELKTERDVRNPILMTNILRKNAKYHKCYELYKFIEKYDKLGVSYKLDEDASIFTDEELSELNTVMLTNYLALKGKDRSKETKGFSRTYKPRILTSLDDEQFIYGDLLRGPIEFLRIDEGYQNYLDAKLRKDLPPHPTKIEKEYYQEELKEIKERKEEKAAIDKLEKRKKKEQAEFDKRAKAIIAQREREEAERASREADEARREEERRIEEVRQALIRDAMFGNDTNPDSVEGSSDVLEQPVVEEEVIEETPVEEEIPAEEEVVEEQLESEEAPVEESEPVEEIVEEEQPQEEQTEEVPSEEPVEEESQEEVIEETPIDEIPAEQPSEEEPVPEEISEEPAEEDLDAIRQQLVADALSEESQEQPEEEVVEEQPSEEQPEIIEEVPTEEPVVEEQPAPKQVEEATVEETPVEQPVIEETPIEETNEEQPVEEPVAPVKKPRKKRKPAVKKAKEEPQPVVEEPETEEPAPQPEVVEEVPTEEPVVEQPSEEQQAPVKKPRKKRTPAVKKPQPVPEVVEEQPAPEQVEESPVEETPAVEEQPQEEENNEIPPKKPTSAKKKPAKKKKKAVKKPKEEPAKIPGRFIVKTNEGYYVNSHRYSVYKHEAFIFDDFNAANKVKAAHGGKVVKL